MSTEALFGRYGSLGAPDQSDAQAWAPAGSSTTTNAAAASSPGIDYAALTPEQKHGLKQAIATGSQAEYEAFEASLRQNSAAAPEASPGGGEPAPYDEGFDPETIAKWAEHGSHPLELAEMTPHFDRFADSLAVLPDDAARHAAVLAAEERTLHRIYHGSEAAMKQGMADLTEAARLLNLDIAEINDSGALADPAVHHRALLAARRILQNRKT